MRYNKNKFYFAVTLLAAAGTFLTAFAFSIRKSKGGISGVLAALAVAAAGAGGAFSALDAAEERRYTKLLRRCCSRYDDWFHSFEYPECREPSLTVKDSDVPSVETENDD